MKKILNCVICAFLSAFLTYAWARFLLKNNLFAAVCACVTGLCTAYVSAYFCDKTTQKENKKKLKDKTIDGLKETLSFGADNSVLLAELLRYFEYKPLSDVRNNDDFFATLNQEKILVCNDFSFDKLPANVVRTKVVKAKLDDAKQVFIFCNAADSQAVYCATSAANHGVTVKLFDLPSLANLLIRADKMPQNITSCDKPKKINIVARYALCRKRAVHYLSAALFFAAISFVSYIKLYNLIWATALFALGMYSLLNKRYNPKTETTTL